MRNWIRVQLIACQSIQPSAAARPPTGARRANSPRSQLLALHMCCGTPGRPFRSRDRARPRSAGYAAASDVVHVSSPSLLRLVGTQKEGPPAHDLEGSNSVLFLLSCCETPPLSSRMSCTGALYLIRSSDLHVFLAGLTSAALA